jgi:hypothetical protein
MKFFNLIADICAKLIESFKGGQDNLWISHDVRCSVETKYTRLSGRMLGLSTIEKS